MKREIRRVADGNWIAGNRRRCPGRRGWFVAAPAAPSPAATSPATADAVTGEEVMQER